MPAPFMLDTNAYYLFFQGDKTPEYEYLARKVEVGGVKSFYIPEIVSMEIHSVIGKNARGKQAQKEMCTRTIRAANGSAKCSNTWLSSGKKRMHTWRVHAIRKLVEDTEKQRGSIQATILAVDEAAIQRGRYLLLKYCDRFSLGSLDALIGGTLLAARETLEPNLTLVTSDRILQAVLRAEGLPVLDPRLLDNQ